MKNDSDLRVALPIPFVDKEENLDEFIKDAIRQAKSYHASEVTAFLPSKGFRAVGYPTDEYIIQCAKMFKTAKEELAKHE